MSAKTTAKGMHAGRRDQPGSKFLRTVLRFMPDDECKAEVREVFGALMREGETRNSIAAFLYLVREYRADVARQAEALRDARGRATAKNAVARGQGRGA